MPRGNEGASMVTDSAMEIESPEVNPSTTDSPARGQISLAPIDGSQYRGAITVRLDLTRSDGVLVLGDLRLAAEEHQKDRHFEAAHRLWRIIAEAAGRIDNQALVTRSLAMGDGALLELKGSGRTGGSKRQGSQDRRRGVSYDYVSLAADRASGLTQRETASNWGCSQATVSRAVSYVTVRDELLDGSPDVTGQIHGGMSVDDLALAYDVETKIMRWIVSDFWDRRT